MVAVWIVGALRTKPTARTEPSARRIGHMGTVIVAAWLMFSHRMPDILKVRVIPASFATGVVLTWAGLAFAIWARFTLGSNWSGVVEVKKEHTLVIGGPYKIVRHPIYSGVLLAMLGTAIGTGEFRGFLAIP